MLEKRDLAEIVGREVTGVTVNPSSVSLSFNGSGGNGGWILVQCRFVLQAAGGQTIGNATLPESAAPLLSCLKRKIVDARFDESKVLTLHFEDEQFLQLIPEKDGLESYVLHTAEGVVPVIDF
ncbi:hypothetical protein VSR82_30485 [Burkholderia sp. JPY481]|uniref:hypothetical protein n=1 Tax=Paraburkholderia sp. JPY465 TaxID=3042285 RepID=UPI00317A92B4